MKAAELIAALRGVAPDTEVTISPEEGGTLKIDEVRSMGYNDGKCVLLAYRADV